MLEQRRHGLGAPGDPVSGSSEDRAVAPDPARSAPTGLPRAGVLSFAGLVGAVTLGTVVGWLPRWPGALHLVALPPLDLVADLRVLLARAPSHPRFLVAFAAVLVVRVAVLAMLAGGWRSPRWRLAAGFYLLATPPALLAAQLDIIARTALYSRLVGASLVLVIAWFVVTAAAPWTGRSRILPAIRRAARDGWRITVLATYAGMLLGLGAAAAAIGPAASGPLVPVSGALTLGTIAWSRSPGPQRPGRHLALVGGLVAIAAATVVLSRGAPWTVSETDRDGSVMLMSGINSASGEGAIFELEPARLGYGCEQFHYFSYAGPGDGQPRGDAACPIRTGAPYRPEHTQRPFDEQVELLTAQLDGLEGPVVVVAHSLAAWVAWDAAARGALDDGDRLVLVGPFPSSPMSFPLPGEDGPGRVAGDLFRLLEPLPDLVDFDFTVDAPLTHELLAAPDAAADVFSRPLPEGVDALAVTASSDLALMPDGWRLPGASDACPVREAHPYLPLTPAFHTAADRFLDGERGDDACPPWPELYRLASQAFGAPPHDR